VNFNLDIPIKKIYVVEAQLQFDGGIVYNVMLVSKKQNQLKKKQIAFQTQPPLKKILKRDYPVVLLINGKGIISKKLEKKGEPTHQSVLNQLLANAHLDTFSLQYFQFSNKIVASAFRKETLNEVVSKIPQKNLIVETYIGDFVVSALSILKSNQDQVRLYRYNFTIKNEEIIDFDFIEDRNDFRYDSEVISPDEIPSYAAALNFYTGIMPTETGGIEWLDFNAQQQQQKFLYNYVRLGLMGLIFIGFLLNDYYANRYTHKITSLQDAESSKVLKQNDLKKLTKVVDAKKKFLSISGIQMQQPHSKFADNIAQSTPEDINLTEIIQDPLEKNLTKKRQAIFSRGKLLVRGICMSSQVVNLWLEDIKALPWVKTAVISDYAQNRKENNSQFELEIIANGNLE